jgi:hypothetical protein
MTAPTRTFVEGRYVPAGPWAARKIEEQVQHLKGRFRPGEAREERTLFDARGTVAGQAAARALLTAAIGPRVVFHRLVLSPGPRSGVARPIDLRTWTRLLLMDLGDSLGQQLVWVAAVHRNTDDPHVHVLLAGAAERTRWPHKGQVLGVELRRIHYVPGGFIRQRGDARAAEIRQINGDGTAA